MNKNLKIPLLFSLLLMAACANAQSPQKHLSVGIFVYPGVEILDFSGPSEVFGSTHGFKPFVVAFKKEPVTAQGFISITPEYSIDDCPPTDILVFPGGGTGSVIDEQKLIDWIRERSTTTQVMMSVCTGAGLLSKAGLLDGKEVTTFHGYLGELQKMTPKAKVLAETRFVDNGQIVTTAGVSAGIDGALHVVAKIKGEEVAKATAFYMEYDKWRPNEGKTIETPFLHDVRTMGVKAAVEQFQRNNNGARHTFFTGEMTVLAHELLAAQPAESEAIFRFLLQNTPPTPGLYDGLGVALKKCGKECPPSSDDFSAQLESGHVDWAKTAYQKARQIDPNWLLFSEEGLNQKAYDLWRGQKNTEALALFKWIIELFPQSPNAWDSLSEFSEATGDNAQAITASETCLAKLPASGYDEQRRNLYRKISTERIARLRSKP